MNILLAVNIFARHCSGNKILIKCDNQEVVLVLKSGRTHDQYLSTCARNIWYCEATHDIDLHYTHIQGVANNVADLLSRWQGSQREVSVLHMYISMLAEHYARHVVPGSRIIANPLLHFSYLHDLGATH